MTPRREFNEYLDALRTRVAREQRGCSVREMTELRSRWESWDRQYQAWLEQGAPSPEGAWYVASRPPAWDVLEVELQAQNLSRPRQRPPELLPVERVSRLADLLKRRRSEGNPARGSLTQGAIATRVDLERHRVQQAEQLLDAGWNLLRSHPDFSADEGYVRWPRVEKARQILAAERQSGEADRKPPT